MEKLPFWEERLRNWQGEMIVKDKNARWSVSYIILQFVDVLRSKRMRNLGHK